MKHHKRISGMILAALMLCVSAVMPAFAAPVASDSPWTEGAAYITEKGYADLGDLNGNVTVREWAVMVCRAYDKDVKTGAAYGAAELKLAYKEGWLDLGAVMDPDSAVCRRYAYESIFGVEGITAFDAELYAEGAVAHEDRFVCAAKENEMCATTDNELDLLTKGEAAYIIYLMQTKDIKVKMPELMKMVNFIDKNQDSDLNSELLEINKVPKAILKQFQADGWRYCVDSKAVDDFAADKGMEYAGVCSYADKSIYVKYDYATVHEFGHYYHATCDAAGFNAIYSKEAEGARAILGDYAATSESEYFAEAFDYWVKWSDSSEGLKVLEQVAPQTYQFFHTLSVNNWY